MAGAGDVVVTYEFAAENHAVTGDCPVLPAMGFDLDFAGLCDVGNIGDFGIVMDWHT